MAKKLEDSDGLKELEVLKQWAKRSIVCPPDYRNKRDVDDAYKLLKSRLEELKSKSMPE